MATNSYVPHKQQRLLQLIECPICLNELQDPRLLSCRHIYCYKCLKDYHKKGNHGNALHCPQCRDVTAIYQGGVDDLPQFFFMNELKEVVLTEDDKPPKHADVSCSTEACGQPGLKYCKQCEFLCQQCFEDHSKARVTKSHQVIPAGEGVAFTKSKTTPYPACRRHKHQVMDLYCRKCNLPICNTCSNSSHRGHDCCELEEQGEMCKKKLIQIGEDMDGLIKVVKQAVDKTTSQVKQAEADIDGAAETVKSTFKTIHDKLSKEEQKMLSDLQAARRRVTKIGDGIVDSQTMTLASLQSLKCCQVKLDAKDSVYDYVTVTDSIHRDINNHIVRGLSGIAWTSETEIQRKPRDLRRQGHVHMSETVTTEKIELTGSAALDQQLKEVGRMHLHVQDKGPVWGMVVYNHHVYVVHDRGLIVYCYTPDGSLSCKYDHKGGANTSAYGMCLMLDGDTAMLVVSDVSNKALIWIKIGDDVTMEHHHTQNLDYKPRGLYNDRGDLLVCDVRNNKIHRYKHDGQKLGDIKLSDNAKPWRVARHGDGNQYVVSDWDNEHLTLVEGQKGSQYKDETNRAKMGLPSDVITDLQGNILTADYRQNQVVLQRLAGGVVRILNQHVISPSSLYVDNDNHMLYVSGKDQLKASHVFIFKYTLPTGNKELDVKITKLDIKVEM